MRFPVLVSLNIVTAMAMIAVNGMANALPINGLNTGQISAFYPNAFVPAGFTFSIWLVIYILVIGFCIFQISGSRIRENKEAVERIGSLFALTNILNASWILAWHYRMVSLSLLIMLLLLLTLVAIHLRLPIPDTSRPMQNRIWIQGTFSVYLGWIMTATIANTTAWFVDKGWKGSPLSEETWAIIMILAAGLLSFLMLSRRKNRIVPLVTVWSAGGIIARQYGANGFNGVALTGSIVCIVLLLAVILSAARRPVSTETV
jgi:hypothetical protein